jgi:hypothetical protein
VVSIRNRPKIWEAWRSDAQVGEARPCTRVTVEKEWWLKTTPATLGTWKRGPARWWQPFDRAQQRETELPNVVSVNMNRSLEADAGSCDIIITNTVMPDYGVPEINPGEFGTPGAFTFDHGVGQDARARWSHATNEWMGVLTPNALIRTYQGFGGHDKTLGAALTDGNIILNGVWLIDDVQITSDGTLSLKCRDMMKLLIDQQLYPPLVPTNLYPAKYERWVTKNNAFPRKLPPPSNHCYHGQYFNSSTDMHYGEWITHATGHPGTDAFDMTPEGAEPFAHQATFWLSEPHQGPGETAWIEFLIDGGNSGDINEIYCHPGGGPLLGYPDGMYYVMVSIQEKGTWVWPETSQGGITPEGVPFVSTFVPGVGGEGLPQNTQSFRLPRMYHATLVRLTLTNLLPTWSRPYGNDWGMTYDYRCALRKVMACRKVNPDDANYNNIVYTGTSIPANNDQFSGYWQVRATGQIYAFGDARLYWPNSPRLSLREIATGMAAHPDGRGYWTVDTSGVVLAAGSAGWYEDRSSSATKSVVDIAATPNGYGYWILERDGTVYPYGDAADYGSSYHSASMQNGAPAHAQSIESHPTASGYWVLWSDGYVDAKGLPNYGRAHLPPLLPLEWYTQIHATSTGLGYWIISGTGAIICKGDAPDHGRSTRSSPEWQGANWFYGLVWDLIRSSHPGDKGYMFQHADGTLEPKGGGTDDFGSIGTGMSRERSPGNYKDYSDIVKDLLLWAGFYLYRQPPVANDKPAVFGNIETTGAWSDTVLPPEMFDKRPVYDAIKDLRDMFGYIFYCDQEGGIRWESPSWWQMGNYLSTGEAFGQMPEIDESVNLLNHSIQLSGGSAWSEIIIADSNPLPIEAGKEVSKTVTQTRIEPKTKKMLRGMQHLYMRTHDKLSNPREQKVMADLIDMKMWFSRRLGQVTCTANPLIDLNDQVRVIERQTGEVWVHYIRSIDTSHDLESGEYTMNLTTHWLGGGPFDKFTIFYAGVGRPQGDGYWTITLGGTMGQNANSGVSEYKSGLYAFGAALLIEDHEADSHTEDIIAIRSTASGTGLYSLDLSGKVLTYGDAVHRGQLNVQRSHQNPGPDVCAMALTPSGNGYWLLQRNGTVTPFGDAVWKGHVPPTGAFIGTSTSPNWAADIEAHPTTMGYWGLDSNGIVTARGVPSHGNGDRTGFTATETYTAIRHTTDGNGYWLLSGSGKIRNKANAPSYGDAGPWTGPWYYGLTWDMIVNPDDTYILVRANGSLESHGGARLYTPVVRNNTKYYALIPADRAEALDDIDQVFPVSADVAKFLAGTGSKAAANAIASNFGTPPDAKKALK